MDLRRANGCRARRELLVDPPADEPMRRIREHTAQRK
jgi:hypothetical protein